MTMDIYEEIDLQDCPVCGGAGLLEEECGWCYYVACLDCDCRTAEVEFRREDQKLEAAKQAAMLWNMGKVISGCPI